jgi:hypothetical protein
LEMSSGVKKKIPKSRGETLGESESCSDTIQFCWNSTSEESSPGLRRVGHAWQSKTSNCSVNPSHRKRSRPVRPSYSFSGVPRTPSRLLLPPVRRHHGPQCRVQMETTSSGTCIYGSSSLVRALGRPEEWHVRHRGWKNPQRAWQRGCSPCPRNHDVCYSLLHHECC